jgi:hypothetical protein
MVSAWLSTLARSNIASASPSAAERINACGVPAGRASAATASSLPAFCWMNF